MQRFKLRVRGELPEIIEFYNLDAILSVECRISSTASICAIVSRHATHI